FYHSNAAPLAIVGTATVVNAGYPDQTAFEPGDSHYDPKSKRDNPTWYMVDIRLVTKFPVPVERSKLLEVKSLEEMMLLKRGSRLSIQPVTAMEWREVLSLAGVKED
ncbi:MAG: EVE domain-containing protein, partial [Planctomycetota bacterium]|nr:EVE domain-containing protein [Planctomycetota bacterium]